MKSPESYPGRPILTNLVLLPSAARTVSGVGEPVTLEGLSALLLQLDVTATATDAGDTLDVYVQTTIDGTNWIDFKHFTQVSGTAVSKRLISKLVIDVIQADFDNGAVLLGGVGRNIFGEQYRVRWDIEESGSANAAFTFSVTANGA